MTDFTNITYEKKGRIAYVTINRPERRNAVDPDTSRELKQAFNDFGDDDALWVAIFTGAGEKAFSAGADLVAMAQAFASGDLRSYDVPFGGITRGFETWKPMIANMFFVLAGRNWVWIVGGVVMGWALVTLIPLACWVYMHPEYHDDLLAAVPWALGSAAALKLLLGACLVRVVIRRHLVETRLMARLLGAWLIIAVCLTCVLRWLVPGGLAPWHLVTCCVVLALPLVRLSLAPLALAWNRHR